LDALNTWNICRRKDKIPDTISKTQAKEEASDQRNTIGEEFDTSFFKMGLDTG
jgi:hypothetical protein